MPYDYILEMICDWWSFSWQSGDLYEIFKWYEDHSKYIKLAPKKRDSERYFGENQRKTDRREDFSFLEVKLLY